MEGQWKLFFEQERVKPYFINLASLIDQERQIHNVLPSDPKNVFKAFNLTGNSEIKVVIVGQDPSPSGDGTGLAFSLPPDEPVDDSDYSINKIFDALEADDEVDFERPDHGCLEAWAQQGVLLLNSILTYRSDEMGGNAHTDIGWKTFTENVLEWLCETQTNLVFMLWGRTAQDCGRKIHGNHKVMEGYHPAASRFSDSLIDENEFIEHYYFSKANTYLSSHNKAPINWQI